MNPFVNLHKRDDALVENGQGVLELALTTIARVRALARNTIGTVG
jgi:hypothetical protein